VSGISISPHQRDLFYEVVVNRITAIDEVWLAIEKRDWAKAQSLGREFADILRFLTEDVGWGDRGSSSIELVNPPDALLRVMQVIAREAAVEDEEERDKRLELAQADLDREEALRICAEIIAKLSTVVAPVEDQPKNPFQNDSAP
jgi:hypothetical protein